MARIRPREIRWNSSASPWENRVLPDSLTAIYILFPIGSRIGPPKMHRWFRIGLPKILRRLRNGYCPQLSKKLVSPICRIEEKNPAYERQSISRPMRIVAPMP